MARRRFFVPSVRRSRAVLEGGDARHLRQVLRAAIGQRYELSDNRSVYLAEIEAFGHDQVVFHVLEELLLEPSGPRLTLYLALIRFDRFEWALEKATELGVEGIVPVETDRSEKGLACAALKRIERWRRIVHESGAQARRARLPEVCPPVRFVQALGGAASHRFFLEEERNARPFLAVLPASAERLAADEVALMVGPEGGWTDQERARAAESGWVPVSLGPRTLRAETAAIAAVSVVSAAWAEAGG